MSSPHGATSTAFTAARSSTRRTATLVSKDFIVKTLARRWPAAMSSKGRRGPTQRQLDAGGQELVDGQPVRQCRRSRCIERDELRDVLPQERAPEPGSATASSIVVSTLMAFMSSHDALLRRVRPPLFHCTGARRAGRAPGGRRATGLKPAKLSRVRHSRPTTAGRLPPSRGAEQRTESVIQTRSSCRGKGMPGKQPSRMYRKFLW